MLSSRAWKSLHLLAKNDGAQLHNCWSVLFSNPNFRGVLVIWFDKIHAGRGQDNTAVVDAIDDFTSKLVKEKSQKWRFKSCVEMMTQTDRELAPYYAWKNEIRKTFQQLSQYDKLDIDTSLLSTAQLDSLVQSALKAERLDDVHHLLQQCGQRENQVSPPVLLLALHALVCRSPRPASLRPLSLLLQSLKTASPTSSAEHAHYEHFLGLAHWHKGNTELALSKLLQVYQQHPHLRSSVRSMLREVCASGVARGSVASLLRVLSSLQQLADAGDLLPLAHLWQCCWCSEWFTDHQLAQKLFQQQPKLREVLAPRMYVLSVLALRADQEEAVQRLLQLLLQHKMAAEYTTTVRALLDHKLCQEDVRSCTEIVRNCAVLGVPLLPRQQHKYLCLYVGGRSGAQDVGAGNSAEKTKPNSFTHHF